MIDLHTHILPGVDDGPATLDGSLEVASACVRDGIRTVAATPHVRDDFPTGPGTMEARVAELREALSKAGIPLEVRGGGEVALDRIPLLADDDLRRFALAGNPRYLLLEFPYYGWPLSLTSVLGRLTALEMTAVLAHPERNPEVQADRERLRPLVEGGVLMQVTAASLDGRIGRSSRETGIALVDQGLAHLLASDAHHAGIRAAGMSAAAEAVGDVALARWLTEDVPGAIVEGSPLPARPQGRRRRGLLSRR